jgi:uncharacterized membrane protein
MKKCIPWIGLTLLAVIVVAFIVNLLLVISIPNAIMEVTITKKFNYPSNQWIFSPPATAASTDVIRPSADLLYSILCYDVSQHPLRVTANLSEYSSISGFSMNSDNFFVIDDNQAKSNPIEVVLVAKGMTYKDPTGKAYVIMAPSTRGILMIGAVVTSQADLPNLTQIQKQATAELIQ